MLVHDDLIDGSVIRRDRPTLHEAIRLDADRPDDPAERKRACDLGLIAGDLLFALGMRLLGRSGLDDAALGRANRLVADMLFETGLGEALDVLYDDCPLEHLSEEQLVESYLRKTARYSVSGPLVLGATDRRGPAAGRPGPSTGSATSSGSASRSRTTSTPSTRTPSTATTPTSTAASGPTSSGAPTSGSPSPAAGALDEALERPAGLDRRRRLLALIADSGAVEACRARLEGGPPRGRRRPPRVPARPRPAPPVRRPDRDVPGHPAARRPSFAVIPIEADGVPVAENGMVDA